MNDDNFDPSRNNEATFAAEIRPHMSKVLQICRDRGIPFMSLFQVSADVFFEHCWIPSKASCVLHSINHFVETAREDAATLN